MNGMGLSSADLMAAIDHYLSPVPEPSSALLFIFAGIIIYVVNGNRIRRDEIAVETCLSRLATTTINQVSW